ncbi:MAG: hypothetical protein GDA43_07165 [Hormoscilla sp. SP5CHS1]|nr:hypothetical protein [Hormoscilla sp. SP12CHS1]MBC6453011.1 hypothetical protein [Hormoscilla sp. SP5CHS1]
MGERCAKNRPFTCWINRQWRSLLMGAIALCGTVVWELLLPVGVPAVASSYRGKPIRNSSSPAKIAPAQHLQQIGAKIWRILVPSLP